MPPSARRRPSERKLPEAVAFGAAARAVRDEQGTTQEVVAERGQLHWSYIGQIERGERNLSLTSILAMARGLGVPASELLDRAFDEHGRPRTITQRSSG